MQGKAAGGSPGRGRHYKGGWLRHRDSMGAVGSGSGAGGGVGKTRELLLLKGERVGLAIHKGGWELWPHDERGGLYKGETPCRERRGGEWDFLLFSPLGGGIQGP